MSKTINAIEKEEFNLRLKEVVLIVNALLKPLCTKLEVVGSIRRGVEYPNDIDIVLIPNFKETIRINMDTLGVKQNSGDKKEAWLVGGVKVELYYATEDTWGAFVLMYTGSKMFNISMRAKAKKIGYTLNQYGLFEPTDSGTTIIAQRTEEDIFKALNMEYTKPENR
jgi:DNA polymerase (family X)